MAEAGRIGDQAVKETHEGELCGPADQAAEHTFINGQRALRVGDGCASGGSTWKATNGSSAVFIEGRPAVRKGDDTTHSGPGNVVKGSPDTTIGDGKGSAPDMPHDRSLTIVLKDASDRDVNQAHLRITCPHPNQKQADKAFNGRTTARSLCAAAKLDVFKSLERGDWDPVAVSGTKLTVSHHVASGAYWYNDPAPEKKVPVLMPDWKKEDQVNIPRVDPDPTAPASGDTPAAPATAGDMTAFPTSNGTATIRMPTAYNWMELVYKAFKLEMPTTANHAAMLGVRDGVLLSDDTHVTRDNDYFPTHEGDGRTAVAVPKDQQQNTTRFADLLFCAIAPTDPAVLQHVEALQCTLDPGIVQSTEGMPLLLEGKLYYGKNPYTHHGPALQLFTSGSTITVARLKAAEGKGAHRTFTELADADVFAGTSKEYTFVVDDAVGDVGILMHSSGDYNASAAKPASYGALPQVKNWSAGCSVLAHAESSARYTAFLQVVQHPANSAAVPYLVVANKYVLSYAEWIAKIQAHPEEKPTPASVLRKEGLQSPTGMEGKYVPSIMTVGFANAALAQSDGAAIALAQSPKTQAANAQNLRQSTEAALFTTVTP